MAKSNSKSSTVKKTGTLRIGDQWNAINIIARSQTHPLKAVCELTENAIDAGSSHIHIVRRRRTNQVYLEIQDDGEGVPGTSGGEPDFARIATHVCDSMKRHLDAQQRAGIHGEFGIGLLSFWSLGDELRMASAAPDGRVFEMLLARGKRDYTIRPVRGKLPIDGTRVVVGPLLESTKNIVTGEKLARYLATELRDRIRSTDVTVVIHDRVARKEMVVKPREYEGDHVEVPTALPTPYGDVFVELYFANPGGGQNEDAGVAVCKDGTRVLKSITELDPFQHPPWSDGRLEGVIDFAALELAPGTRSGIVPNERLSEFTRAVSTLETALKEAIDQREKAESDKASRNILKQVHRAFRNALKELPSNEYLFFDIPEVNRALARQADGTRGAAGSDDGMAVPESTSDAASPEAESEHEDPLLPLEPGPLAAVRIMPRRARREPGQTCPLKAAARDEHGFPVENDVGYVWSVTPETARLDALDNEATLHCDAVGAVQVRVVATQDRQSASDEVTVKILENAAGDDSAKGLPSYRLEAEHGKPWRSRYDAKANEIIINSAHRDFLSSRKTAAKHRRYIGKLYAKEVVLINFPHESPDQVLERLIELTLRTEDVL